MSEILENIETPIQEETQTETENSNGSEIVELPQRVNDFCVISKFTWENGGRDIQKNSGWSANPYPEDYAVVPDDMVPDIEETRGFCDIVLNEDGTEVVEFTAREIPEFPDNDQQESEQTEDSIWDEMALAIEEGVNEV
ncbi:MAG: hypothetical protein J6J38_07865 [Lachnospiraceae bacterium]|nr:hypothetical protein [Lachnospiraceae bacterium]